MEHSDADSALSNEEIFQRSEREFLEFKELFLKGICPICKKPLKTFSSSKPCMHWLLKPNGFRKKDFPRIVDIYDQQRIEAFLRWIANIDVPFRKINDLALEHRDGFVIAVTIGYKHLEWAFSASNNEFHGDATRPPHYHFQMRIGGQSFIRYGEHHIPLTQYDIWCLNAKLGRIPGIKHVETHGAGMESVMSLPTEKLLTGMRNADEGNAMLRVQTLITSKSRKGISGKDFAAIIEESKRTGIPIARLSRKLPNANVSTFIQPADEVIVPADRKPPRKRRNKATK